MAELTKEVLQIERPETDVEPYDYAEDVRKDEEILNADIVSEKSIEPVFGRPKGTTKPDNLTEVAKRIGISEKTIVRAQNHVEAVRKYPELVAIPTQKDALTIAKNLDALPESELEATREKLKRNDSATLVSLAEKSPMREREFASGESPGEKWAKMLLKNQSFLTNIDNNGGVDSLWKYWTRQQKQAFYQNVCHLEKDFSNLRETMEDLLNNESYEDARQNVA